MARRALPTRGTLTLKPKGQNAAERENASTQRTSHHQARNMKSSAREVVDRCWAVANRIRDQTSPTFTVRPPAACCRASRNPEASALRSAILAETGLRSFGSGIRCLKSVEYKPEALARLYVEAHRPARQVPPRDPVHRVRCKGCPPSVPNVERFP